MPYTAAQIEEAVDNASGYSYDGAWPALYASEAVPVMIDGDSVLVEYHDSFGGENLGSKAYVVVKVGDQLFKKDAYYASHDGYYWDGEVTEVKPVEKTITVYENV